MTCAKPFKSKSFAEIITLRAIALKLSSTDRPTALKPRRDHNATSYSTETFEWFASKQRTFSRDHNATSYSTETFSTFRKKLCTFAEIITLRAIALKRQNSLNG